MGMNYDEVVGDGGRGGRRREQNQMSKAAGGWYYFAIVKVSPSSLSVALLSPSLPPSLSPVSCEANPGPKWEQR